MAPPPIAVPLPPPSHGIWTAPQMPFWPTGRWAMPPRCVHLARTARSAADEEALQALYQSLLTGLQFNADTRLGRPLGTFDRPRPRRAEAWRSGRSLANLATSLAALEDLSALLSDGHAEVAAKLAADFARLDGMTDALEDPTFAGVSEPMARIRIEALQTAVNAIRETVTWQLGAALGVQEGFNALDGD